LRPEKHFGLPELAEFLLEELIADEGYVVERNGDGGIGGDRNRLGANAADLDAITTEVRFREGQVRNLFDQIRSACRLCRRQLFLGQRGDGNRNALHIRTTQLGRSNCNGFHCRALWRSLSQRKREIGRW